MRMQIIEDGIKKFGSVAKFQYELARAGIIISATGLTNILKRKNESIKFPMLCAIVDVVYDGDWPKVVRIIEREFKVKNK